MTIILQGGGTGTGASFSSWSYLAPSYPRRQQAGRKQANRNRASITQGRQRQDGELGQTLLFAALRGRLISLDPWAVSHTFGHALSDPCMATIHQHRSFSNAWREKENNFGDKMENRKTHSSWSIWSDLIIIISIKTWHGRQVEAGTGTTSRSLMSATTRQQANRQTERHGDTGTLAGQLGRQWPAHHHPSHCPIVPCCHPDPSDPSPSLPSLENWTMAGQWAWADRGTFARIVGEWTETGMAGRHLVLWEALFSIKTDRQTRTHMKKLCKRHVSSVLPDPSPSIIAPPTGDFGDKQLCSSSFFLYPYSNHRTRRWNDIPIDISFYALYSMNDIITYNF